MSKRKPPLEPVRVVRSSAVDAAARAMREAAEAARRKAEQADAAREDETRFREETSAKTAQEIEAMRATASVRDLTQLAAFEVGRAIEIDRKAAETEAAARAAEAAKAHEEAERSKLANARVSLDVVEKHQRHWRDDQAKKEQERVDEQAEESFAARRKV